jgi:aldehyde dehydrogenase (NAD+)
MIVQRCHVETPSPSNCGPVVGEAISGHSRIDKVAFTGSVLTGKDVLQAVGASNVKSKLGGKSASMVFNDVGLEKAVKWSSMALVSFVFC